MANRVSAGILFYRVRDGTIEYLLAHPGGPLYASKDEGYWSIPKGGPEEGEPLDSAAIREVREELGIELDRDTPRISLGVVVQKGGKVVHAWAIERSQVQPHWDKAQKFELEWPPRSGKKERFLEVDRAEFFRWGEAVRKIKPSQIPFLERLSTRLGLAQSKT